MTGENKKLLCAHCRRLVPYEIRGRKEKIVINGTEIEYYEKYGVCRECDNEITVPNLDDENENKIDEIYRKKNGYITIEQIEQLLTKYHVEKRPLSNLLGWGELTITRYLEGQLPGKAYSDVLIDVLGSDSIMESYLLKNRENITAIAYAKILSTIEERKRLYNTTTIAERIAIYMIHSDYDITNMFLQKLLYYTKAIGYVFYDRDIVEMDCEAWAKGPVFPLIYEKYKSFGKESLNCDNMELDVQCLLTEEEKKVADFILDNFGRYNGRILSDMTHKEQPWQKARVGFEDGERCENVISGQSICEYFRKMDEIYDLKSEAGIQAYIHALSVI